MYNRHKVKDKKLKKDKYVIVHKPLSLKMLNVIIKDNNPLVMLTLSTGARIAELKRLIDTYKGDTIIDIKTKMSGENFNRFYLNKQATNSLIKLVKKFKGKTTKTLQREFKKVSTKLNIPFTAHNLRANFATNLLSNGVDLVKVQKAMHHSNIMITARYIDFDENSMMGALKTLDDIELFEGMNIFQAKKEIIRLRKLLSKEKDGK